MAKLPLSFRFALVDQTGKATRYFRDFLERVARLIDQHLRMMLMSPTASESITLAYLTRTASVQEIVTVLEGTTPTVTWSIRHSTVRNGAGTELASGVATSTTTGDSITSFSDNKIPANSFVWFETSATTGTVDSIYVSLRYN